MAHSRQSASRSVSRSRAGRTTSASWSSRPRMSSATTSRISRTSRTSPIPRSGVCCCVPPTTGAHCSRSATPSPTSRPCAPAALEARLQRHRGSADGLRHPARLHLQGEHACGRDVRGRATSLLVGDAAHVNNPLGGMGMNSGIHDAWAAALCVDAALTDTDDTHAATFYSELRRDAALNHVQAQAQKNYDSMRSDDDEARAARADELSAMDIETARQAGPPAGLGDVHLAADHAGALGSRAACGAEGGSSRRTHSVRDCSATARSIAPGAYDGVTARRCGRCRLRVAYVSGAAVSATALGQSRPRIPGAGRDDRTGPAHDRGDRSGVGRGRGHRLRRRTTGRRGRRRVSSGPVPRPSSSKTSWLPSDAGISTARS